MDIGNRLLQIMNEFGYSKTEFASKLQVSPAVLSHISSGRNKPGLEIVIQLLQNFPEVSAEWLLRGKGQMKLEPIHDTRTSELHQLIDEISLLNSLNYNGLKLRLDELQSKLGKNK